SCCSCQSSAPRCRAASHSPCSRRHTSTARWCRLAGDMCHCRPTSREGVRTTGWRSREWMLPQARRALAPSPENARVQDEKASCGPRLYRSHSDPVGPDAHYVRSCSKLTQALVADEPQETPFIRHTQLRITTVTTPS